MALSPLPMYKTPSLHVYASWSCCQLLFPDMTSKSTAQGQPRRAMGWTTLTATSFILMAFSPLSEPKMELVLENNQKTKIWGLDLIVTGVQNKIKSTFLTFTNQFLKSFYLTLVAPILSQKVHKKQNHIDLQMFPLPEKNVVIGLPSSFTPLGSSQMKKNKLYQNTQTLINQKVLKMFQKTFLRTRCLDLQKNFPGNLKLSLDTQDSIAESMISP